MATQALAVIQHLANGGRPAVVSYISRLSDLALVAAGSDLCTALAAVNLHLEYRTSLLADDQPSTEPISVPAKISQPTDTSSTSPQT